MIGIYKFTSKTTGLSYIGQSVHVEERQLEHLRTARDEKRNHTKWYQALQKYGIDDFDFSILEECSADQLNEKEIYWIAYYDSFQNGYNSSPGGQQKYFNPQAFYDAWDEGLSPLEIAQRLNVGTSCVYNYLIGYKNYSKHEAKVRGGKLAAQKAKIQKNGDALDTSIYQYDLDGLFIKKWNSCKEVSRELGYDASLIGRCVAGKNKSAYNYQWKNFYKDRIDSYKSFMGKARPVIQFDLQGNKLKVFPSVAAAGREIKCDSRWLRKVCNDPQNKYTAKGFKWRWATEENT